MAKIKIELSADPDINIFFKKGTIGGISYISNRYSKHLKSYDAKQESKYIIYLDANNLYGYAMSKFLPASEFKWLEQIYTNNNSKRCFLKLILNIQKNYANYILIIV